MSHFKQTNINPLPLLKVITWASWQTIKVLLFLLHAPIVSPQPGKKEISALVLRWCQKPAHLKKKKKLDGLNLRILATWLLNLKTTAFKISLKKCSRVLKIHGRYTKGCLNQNFIIQDSLKQNFIRLDSFTGFHFILFWIYLSVSWRKTKARMLCKLQGANLTFIKTTYYFLLLL